MSKRKFITCLGLFGLMAFFAAGAYAQTPPSITVVPTTTPATINCSESITYIVHYEPNDFALELWSFNIGITNDVGNSLVFDAATSSSDVTNIGWTDGTTPGFLLTAPTGPYQMDISGVNLTPSTYIPAGEGADLFSITMHGSLDGPGELNITSVALFEGQAGNSIAGVTYGANPVGSIPVDCVAPPAPVMTAEPLFTSTDENTVYWGAVTDPAPNSTPLVYTVRRSEGTVGNLAVEFETALTDYTFGGCVHGVTYLYDVKVRDNVGNESAYSTHVASTQDREAPTSTASVGAAAYNVPFNVDWVAGDALSGVFNVQLRYRHKATAAGTYGPVQGFGVPIPYTPYAPFVFTAPDGDGFYKIFTLATDKAIVGNLEDDPEADAVEVEVDTSTQAPPVLHAEPPYTQGTTNTVSWDAVADAAYYDVHCSSGEVVFGITALEYEFGNPPFPPGAPLADGTPYSYLMFAYDALGNMSTVSNIVSSTQDDTVPTSGITNPVSAIPPAPPTTSLSQAFAITITHNDPSPGTASGVDKVRLWYTYESGPWVQFGDGFAGPTIPFVAPADGNYTFYTSALDVAGNEEIAPPFPDLVLVVDSAGPEGTFLINNGDEYTMSSNVTIGGVFTDTNGMKQMQFTNDLLPPPAPPGTPDFAGPSASGWVTYADSYPVPPATWPLLTGDGIRTVYAQYEDNSGYIVDVSDSIEVDSTPPAAVGLPNYNQPVPCVVAGHETITLTWVDPADADLAEIEIWYALWDDVQNAVGNTIYPEYYTFNKPGASSPQTPASLALDLDWEHLATVGTGVETFLHEEAARGGYSYYFFAKDLAGNYSTRAGARTTINYILGDFTGDGEIGIGPDVSPFAGAYGSVDGDTAYGGGFYDIGPTDNWGVPVTDDVIGFPDLMVLSVNFHAQAKAAVGDPETPILTWFQVDELTWALGLTEACNSLKGVRLAHALPEGITAEYSLAAGIEGSPVYFLGNQDRDGLDLGFAVLGNNSVFPGSGEILRVTTSEAMDMSRVAVEVRDAQNQDIEFELKSEPIVVLPKAYVVENNYPNPFNPQTTIKFALPEAQDVKLEIFDIKGYRVRVLMNESLGAGHHSVIWNGTDGSGRGVASGTYFYRIQAGPLNQTHRMLLLK